LGERGILGLAAACALATAVTAVEVAPSFPTRHFDDRAAFVSPAVAARLDDRLRAFETRTGHSVYVSIFPKLPSASLEEFTVRTATAWRVGRKGLDDGVILFAFVADRKLRIEVGYGLEADIPDAVAHRILEERITPELKAGRTDAAFEAGVAAILAAAEGRPLPAPSVASAAADQGDVPMPETRGLHDEAGLLTAAAAAQVGEHLEQIERDTRCRLAVTLKDGAPPSARYPDAQTFTVRSFFRAHPMTDTPSDRWAEEQRQSPSALLFVFVTSRQPLQARAGYFGTCLAEEVGRAVMTEALEPRLAADPGAALLATLDLHVRAQRGEWQLPIPAASPEAGTPEASRLDSVIDVVKAIAFFRFLGLPVGLAFLVMAVPLSTSPVLRFFPIRRRFKRGESLPRAWVIESLILLWLVVSNIGSSSSGGSTTSSGGSSSSGGGGRFGGGGASGSW